MSDDDILQTEWIALLSNFGVAVGPAISAFREVSSAYQAADRFYHTLDHVQAVLEQVEALAAYALELPPVQLAAWLHDVVYQAGAADNEVRSAHSAQLLLERLGLPVSVVGEVARLILLTEEHQAPAGDGSGHVLLDADLAILASPPPRYKEYVGAIRQEYAHLSPSTFRSGRAAVLRRLLARPHIYFTPPMRVRCEAQARHNLRQELEQLERAA